MNGYRLSQWLYHSEPASSWIENFGIGQNRLNAFFQVHRSVDLIDQLPGCQIYHELKHGMAVEGVSRVPPRAGGGAPAPPAPARAPGSLLLFRAEKEFEGCQFGSGPLKVFSPVEEAREADSKLLHQAALLQAVLRGGTKTQGPYK